MKYFLAILLMSFLMPDFITMAQEPGDHAGKILELMDASFEGYSASTCENDFSYHSTRDDITASMITRCTDGNMPVSWLTSAITVDFSDQGAGFLWMASMDITDEEHQFRVLIDGTERFRIISSATGGDRQFSGSEGGLLGFYELERDQHNDAHGYMRLWAPASWLTPGKPLEVTIVGEGENSNAWIIIYKATDALEYLRKSSVYNLWFRASFTKKGNNGTLTLTLPGFKDGSEIRCWLDGSEEVIGIAGGGKDADAILIMDKMKAGNNLVLSDSSGDFCVIDLSGGYSDTTIIREQYIIGSKSGPVNEYNFVAEGYRKYNPGLRISLLELSREGQGKGEIFLMSSSHQDIAWMDSPEKCVIERDTMLLMPLILDAKTNPGIRFDIEDALMVREFVGRHPEMKEDITRLFAGGNISCGSTFIQPYEEMYSGESLARQFYLGARWLKKEFNYEPVVYWNVDVPGRTLQMPQIMKKAGTDYIVMSRFEKGLFRLESPDGSYVTAYSPGHYGSAYTSLQKEFPVSARLIADESVFWYRYSMVGGEPAIPLLSASDMSPARDFTEIARRWNSIAGSNSNGKDGGMYSIPTVRPAIADSFFIAASSMTKGLPVVKGERPAVWLYIHGPSHYEALKAGREADILLPVAEKFWTALSLVNNDFSRYPHEALGRAWEAKIYPDHGWGGKEGNTTDDLFLSKYIFARSEAEKLLGEALERLSSSVNYNEKLGQPVYIFNSLNWSRNDIATVEITLERGEGKGIIIFDRTGKVIPSQLSEISRYPGGELRSATVTFVAEDVPPIGYTTYYYKPSENAEYQPVEDASTGRIENRYYVMELDRRGISYLLDRDRSIELIGGKDMRGGEVFTMQSIGNGAGEFSDIQQPGMDGYDYTGSSDNGESWKVTDNGKVFTTYMIRQKIRNATVERKIRLYHQIRKIDIDVSLLNWDGALFREFRLGLPLNMPGGKISYEVPFGVVEVGKDEMKGAAGERYTTECADIHPRGIQNWIGASDSNIGVTLSSSVAVADYIDPRDNPLEGPVLQPILLASRQSCHWEGNDYLQAGDHSYHFSLTTHMPGWENGYRFGMSANERLFAVSGYKRYSGADLPETMSFFSMGAENIIVSAVKKAEDDENIIIRAYDITGKDTSAGINIFRDYRRWLPVSLIEFQSKDSKPGEPGNKPFIGRFSIETFKVIF